MKSNFYKSFPIAMLAASMLVTSAAAKSVKVTLTRKNDDVVTGFVVKGDAANLWIASTPTAPNGAALPWSEIANIYWEEPDDWKAGWKLWVSRDYAEAAKSFAALAATYENLSQIEDSIGAKAKYYQLECLRRLGDYSQLMDSYDEVKRVKLSASYSKQIQLFNYWGHVGKKLWEPLQLITNRFQFAESDIPAHTVAPSTMPLKGIEANLMVQVAYMRGIATEMLARKEYEAAVAALNPQVPETQQLVNETWAKVKAPLTDYSRVYTLTYMSDRHIAKEAMERSMGIIKDDPSYKDNYLLQKEAYALAAFYKDLFGKGGVPKGFEAFLVEPQPPSESLDEAAPASEAAAPE